ncbi:MAG TPA: CDP-alcohol phosphatidyltransferase family protein, partial [Anaerolineales bacterium]|nr:CDP-alcohol phosphatidyltransferase family protein [Anaerolineales bacterium]
MTTSAISETKPNFIRSILAWGVHLFTATGAIWGLLGIFAIFENNYKMMIVWMIVAMLVDGFDGMLARWADVKKYANGIDGALLDNILDYLNYVLVPAIFMIHTDLLPEPVKWLTACLILLTSAYQFTQTDAKTDDHHFKGFPSYWNVAALYMLLMNLPPWVNFGFLMLF